MSHSMNAAAEAIKTGSDAVADSYRSGRDKMRDWEEDLEEQIQEWPMSSVLIAVGVGLVFGYLLRGGTRAKPKRSRR